VDSLRIHDESRAVARIVHKHLNPTPSQPIQVPLVSRARDTFYLEYISHPLARCWTFLQPYHCANVECPQHLSSAIEALSLAYLWHETDSEIVLLAALRCYAVALGHIRVVLNKCAQAMSRMTVSAALILDIVDKILSTCSQPPKAHVDGAVCLVKTIGLSDAQEQPDLSILLLLTNQSMISSLALQQPIDPDILAWRTTLEESWPSDRHPQGVTVLFARYAELQHRHATRQVEDTFYAWECSLLDAEIARLELTMPAFWQYRLVELGKASQERFGQYCHVYSHRNICQARNLQRVCRLLLNEAVVDYAPFESDDECLRDIAHNNIDHIVTDIRMSVAALADCRNSIQRDAPHGYNAKADRRDCCGHTSTQTGDCYTLIFPLYAAARSKVSNDTRLRIMSCLSYLADHFSIRNAKMVAQTLESGQYPEVWNMYARLGSYAFHM
jgi:hypothetical protein